MAKRVRIGDVIQVVTVTNKMNPSVKLGGFYEVIDVDSFGVVIKDKPYNSYVPNPAFIRI